MITLEKLRIFEKYNGDADCLGRAETKSEKEGLDNNDWLLIDCMIQDLQLIKNGLSSKIFEDQITKILKNEFDSSARELIQKDYYFRLRQREVSIKKRPAPDSYRERNDNVQFSFVCKCKIPKIDTFISYKKIKAIIKNILTGMVLR